MKRTFLFLSLFILLSSCSQGQSISVSYDQLKQQIESERLKFQTAYTTADAPEKLKLIIEARTFVFNKITTDLFNAWYGPPWDFNGTTTIPRQGKIACGYFVTTVLQDAGFDIPRIKWAQLASETFILELTSDVKRFSNKPIEDVIAYIKQQGDGLYIVGLDVHVGFIYKSGNTILFEHSNYYNPDDGVMAQALASYQPLSQSSYRIVGKILGDDMMERWVMGNAYN